MATDAVAEVKARLDILDVVGGYVRLQRSGRSHKGLCPFHSEKTPSFHVDQEKQAFYCFGCQEGGDIFSFVMRVERIDFMQALEMLAERAGVELDRDASAARRGSGRRRRRSLELSAQAQAFYEYVLWSTPVGEPGRQLLVERGVSEELARTFGVGFAPAGGHAGDALTEYLVRKHAATADEVVAAGLAHPADRGGSPRDRFRHRLVFPMRDERGQTLGFGGRNLGELGPKYLNTPATDAFDKSTALFGIDLAKEAMRAAGSALLVEGYFDVVAAHAAGLRNAVASSGTALTRQQVRLLGRYAQSLVLCFDSDDAGQAATRRAVDTIAGEGLEARIVVLPAGAKDPDELVRRDPAAFAACVAAAQREWQVLLDHALAGCEGGSVEQRRAGAGRAVALLAHIPEATARDLYVQQAARRLEIEVSSVAADVTRALQRPGAHARVVAAIPAPVAARAGAAEAGAAAEHDGEPEPGPLPPWEAYLAAIAVQRPDLLVDAVGERGLHVEELTSRMVRRIVEVALGGDPHKPFPMHLLGEREQSLAARLQFRSVPEFSADAPAELVARAVADCVQRIRESSLMSQISTVQRDRRLARDGGRAAEADELAVLHFRLVAELQRLRGERSAVLQQR